MRFWQKMQIFIIKPPKQSSKLKDFVPKLKNFILNSRIWQIHLLVLHKNRWNKKPVLMLLVQNGLFLKHEWNPYVTCFSYLWERARIHLRTAPLRYALQVPLRRLWQVAKSGNDQTLKLIAWIFFCFFYCLLLVLHECSILIFFRVAADNRHVNSTQTTVWRITDRVTHVIASRFNDFIRMPDPEVINDVVKPIDDRGDPLKSASSVHIFSHSCFVVFPLYC